MSIRFRSTELTSAEASFLKWQYGFDEEDEPFERALWQAIELKGSASHIIQRHRRNEKVPKIISMLPPLTLVSM
jgi:hypothetical protein